MAVPVWRRSPRAWPSACGRPPGICEGGPALHGMPLSRSGGIADPAVFCESASPRFAKACGTGSKRRQSAVPQVRAMPCWRACGPARWGRRSSYGNGFAIFSRYVTEPRDLPSESSRPTPDIRLSALIRAIVSPWKGVSEPPSSATVKYRSFSSIPLPCPEEQGDAGGRRRAIARLHRAVPLGMRGDPLRAWGTADRRPCRARFAGRAPRACRRAGERRDRAAGTCLTCEKPIR